jgi:MFS family permease
MLTSSLSSFSPSDVSQKHHYMPDIANECPPTDSMGFGPCAWIYASEIFPANCRSKGLGISSSGASLGSIIVGQVWPVAVSRIGPKVYFIFMSFNVFSAILVYSCYPETKNKTLEELDSHFGSLNVHSEEDATPKQMLAGEEQRVEMRGKSV